MLVALLIRLSYVHSDFGKSKHSSAGNDTHKDLEQPQDCLLACSVMPVLNNAICFAASGKG